LKQLLRLRGLGIDDPDIDQRRSDVGRITEAMVVYSDSIPQ
jgi:hypothetical protein